MINTINKPLTIFIDIDGTILYTKSNLHLQYVKESLLLNGTIDKFIEWDRKGYNIILTTGRRESMRRKTEEELERLGIFYDQLIMGLGGGKRILINDRKPDSEEDTAIAINVTRNEGIKNINI
jgi:uncharacterized HAD superfamily protein